MQSIVFAKGFLRRRMDPRVKPAGDAAAHRAQCASLIAPYASANRDGLRAFKSIAALLDLWHIFQRLALVPSFVAT
jgi:hypothetical protein